jgi:hypothetical protein
MSCCPADDAFVLVVPPGPTPASSWSSSSAPGAEGARVDGPDGWATRWPRSSPSWPVPTRCHEDQARLGVGRAGLAGARWSGEGPGASLVAAGLFLGVDHVATVGIGTPEPNRARAGTGRAGCGGGRDPAALDLPEVTAPRRSPP